MDLSTLIKEFDDKKGKYHLITTTEEQKAELLKEMKECLRKMNGGKEEYVFKMFSEGKVTSISKCVRPEELYEIRGNISLVSSSDKMSGTAGKMH